MTSTFAPAIAMTEVDILSAALCAWKENRGGGTAGMQSVINVIVNRAIAAKSSCYAEVYRPFQFSSMSYQHDPQLLKQPDPDDQQWSTALALAVQASTGTLDDITQGAQWYYAESISEPSWAAKMTQTVVVAGQRFYKA